MFLNNTNIISKIKRSKVTGYAALLTIYIDCGNLTAPTDGEVSMPSGTTINQVAIYECDVGHQMSGDGFRICLDNSSWSGSAPTCSKIGKHVTRISSEYIQG